MRTHYAGVVSSNSAHVTIKALLARKTTGNRFIKSTSLEKSLSPVTGYMYSYIGMYGYTYMAMYVWLYMYGYVCMPMYVWLCMYDCMYGYVFVAMYGVAVCLYGHVSMAMYVTLPDIHSHTYAQMHVCMYACMYVRLFLSVCVYCMYSCTQSTVITRMGYAPS